MKRITQKLAKFSYVMQTLFRGIISANRMPLKNISIWFDQISLCQNYFNAFKTTTEPSVAIFHPTKECWLGRRQLISAVFWNHPLLQVRICKSEQHCISLCLLTQLCNINHTSYFSQISQMVYVEKIYHMEKFPISNMPDVEKYLLCWKISFVLIDAKSVLLRFMRFCVKTNLVNIFVEKLQVWGM